MFALALACSRPAPTVSFDGLVAEMLDRDSIARMPLYGVAGVTSADPSGGDDDRGHYVRDEEHDGRTEHVLVDAAGPGALVRLWTANPERGGTLRIRLDGAEEPWLESGFAELMAGNGLVPGPLAATHGRGSVLLLPVPFQDRLLVTIDASTGKGLYYAAQLRTWPRGTRVEDTPMPLRVPTLQLEEPGPIEGAVTSSQGPTPQSLRLTGPGAVRSLRFRVPPDRLDDLWVVADTDGARTIEVPLGGLAGLGPRAADVHTWWIAASADGAIEVRFPLPYTSSLVVTLEARGAEPVPVTVAATVGPPIDGAMALHGAAQDQSVGTRPRPEVSFAALRGPGVYVADTLRIDNPAEGWWGMGDERLLVDGRGWTGTGTEDWYGSAWCSHAPFSSLLAAQSWASAADGETACEHAGGGAVYTRGRVLDAIPFRDAFDLRFEVAHRDDTTLRMRTTILWYAPSAAPP